MTCLPTKDDRFSFGLWTVGWRGVDVFGGAVRPPLDPVAAVHKLAELGAAAVTFHDDDVVPDESTRAETLDRFKKALVDTGMGVEMVTTNLFGHPVFKDGGLTANDRAVRRYALAKVLRNLDLAAELGAGTYVLWGGREGAESGAAKDVAAALDRYREALNILCDYVREQGYDIRFALEPKPNEPRGDILLPTIGHALAFIYTLDDPDRWAEPRGGSRGDGRTQLRTRHRPDHVARQALPHRPQRPARSAIRPGLALRRGKPARRLLDGRCARGRWNWAGLRGVRPLRLQATRTEDIDDVWETARACMRNYLILRERVRAFRADPEVKDALEAARVAELALPTLADGEKLADLRAEQHDLATLATRGMHFERLDQLAMEHLIGTR